MATRTTSVKIPHNPRVVRARGGKRIAHDTVSPSVRGIRTIAPSTIGIADREYFSRIAKVAQAAGDALAICQKLRATGDASSIDTVTALTQILSQIIDQLRAEVDAVIAKMGAKDSIIHPSQEGDPAAVSGQDSANAYTAWTPEAIAARDASAKRVSELHAISEMDSTQNKARALFGMNPVSVDNEDLYGMFEGKK